MKKKFLPFLAVFGIFVLCISINSMEDRMASRAETLSTTADPKETSRGTGSPTAAPAAKQTALSVKSLRKLPSGTVVNTKNIKIIDLKKQFYSEKLTDEIKTRIRGKSYKEDCTVPYGDLRYVRVLYYGFDEKTHIGELIVNTAIANDITAIFYELYKKKYPIEKMVLVDAYDGDDNASMADNNTSSFNYRAVSGSAQLSKHALGLAIDINPLYNPYVKTSGKKTVVLPEEGLPYVDRTLDCSYYIKDKDICCKAFTKRDFTWGGSWKSVKDYQHFEKAIP